MQKLKLYLLSQKANHDYETYDSCIICAESEDDAKMITPENEEFIEIEKSKLYHCNWVWKKSQIECKEIGTANEQQIRGVILASFNAG